MLSLPHLIIIFLIALMVFGPEKLPELARMLGKGMAEFRKMTGDVRRVIDDEMREIERQTRETEARKREAATTVQSQPQAQLTAAATAESGAPAGTVPFDSPSGAKSADDPSAEERPPIDEPTTVQPTIGKPQALAMEPAPESEIDRDYSHVKHNPS